MKKYDVNHLKLMVNGEHSNLGCCVDLIKDKPINMEKYIASYKHLIGCEVCHQEGTSLCTNIITSVSDCHPFGTSGVVHDARGLYENQLPFNLLKFYLDENATGTYEEYMQLHYPEYEHIWKQQL